MRELILPVYGCRSCESLGHDPLIAKAVLPPEPLSKCNIGAGPSRVRRLLTEQRPRVLTKPAIGEAVTYTTNQWPTLGVHLTDGRQTIDNAAAEQAIRPLCVGRRNWLHLGGDGGLVPSAVLLSTAASAKRHGIDPWAYLAHVLTELPGRPAGADLTDLLPDGQARTRSGLGSAHG